MTSKFKYLGQVEISHINARKEGPDDDKVLAVDLKLTAFAHASSLSFFDELLAGFLYTDIGAVRNVMMGPIPFKFEIDDYRLEMLGSTHFGVKVKKFSIEPKDDHQAAISFQISFKPSGDEVAQLAEYLQDEISIVLEPSSEELDLGAPKGDSGKRQSQLSIDYTDGQDELYPEACNVVIKQQRVSISLVQRHLCIGYNRAARLIEAMEQMGLVSAMDARGERQVLVTNESLRVASTAIRDLNDMLAEDGTTATLEHNGEVLATLGKDA